eukprot:g10442.t1 g10442   contig4:1890380-1891021(+)
MPVAGDVRNPSPPGRKSPPESNNLCTEVNDLQLPINNVLSANKQPANHAPTPDNDKRPTANEKAPIKRKRRFSNEVAMCRQRRASEMAANMLKNDLTPLQQTLVDGAIHGSGPLSEVLASSGSDNMQRGSMQRLKPKAWLNDEVVNYFVKVCLASRDKNMHNDNTNHRRSHFFNSFFVQTLFNEKNGNANEKGKYKYSNVKRWHKHVPGKNIF